MANKKDRVAPLRATTALFWLRYLPKKNKVPNTKKGIRARRAAESNTYNVVDSSCIGLGNEFTKIRNL
jgi:hypothetical protein